MNTRSRCLLISSLIFLAIQLGQSQDTIWLNNPSFEDQPRNSSPPRGWLDCGFEGETPPDVQPGGGFDVNRPAQDGRTYLGMVCRDNRTNEMVTQKLKSPLQPGKCYQLSLWACRSETYESLSRTTEHRVSYDKPISLQVWLGNNYCNEQFKVGTTPPIYQTDWVQYIFEFAPDYEYQYIKLVAGDLIEVSIKMNGNILIDNLSPIIEIPCWD